MAVVERAPAKLIEAMREMIEVYREEETSAFDQPLVIQRAQKALAEAVPAIEYAVGDVVYLKSGSPPLTVISVFETALSVGWLHDGGAETYRADARCFVAEDPAPAVKSGALWSREQIDAGRVATAPGALVRIVVAVEPVAGAGGETGIIVAGLDDGGHYFVLADVSGAYSSNEWARAAVDAFFRCRGDRLVAEIYNCGEMVEAKIRTIADVSFRGVHASRGKLALAGSAVALYRQGRVHHVGTFPTLEDQMCASVPHLERTDRVSSPRRVHALALALIDLLGEPDARRG